MSREAIQDAVAPSHGPAPTDLRAALEGTWELEEWHVDGQVLRPPTCGGRWLNHDGVVVFMIHRRTADGAESRTGYGVYEMDAGTWSYRYDRRENVETATAGPAKVTVPEPGKELRPFRISHEGSKIVLEDAGSDRREYDGDSFVLMQDGHTVRKWRKVLLVALARDRAVLGGADGPQTVRNLRIGKSLNLE